MDELDDLLRSAAEDLRAGTANSSVPEFAPRRSGSGALAAVVIVLLALGAFAGVRALADSDGTIIDQATDDETVTDDEAVTTTDIEPNPDGGQIIEPVDIGVLITDGDPVPFTEVNAPNPTGGQDWLEPDFGTRIYRLTTNASGAITTPMPSSTQAFNADGSAFLLYRENLEGASHVLFDSETLREIGPVAIGARDAGDFSWHPTDPDLVYYPDTLTNKLIETDVRSSSSRSAITFDQCDQVDQGLTTGSTAGSTGHMGLLCHSGDETFHMTHDLATNTTVVSAVQTTAQNAPVSASLDGSLFVVVEEDQVLVLGPDLAPTSISPIPEDVNRYALSVGGTDEGPLLVISSYDTAQGPGLAIVYNLITGMRTAIVSEVSGDGFPPSGIGLAASADTGLVAAVSRTPEPGEVKPWFGELVLIDPRATSTYRLGRHRMGTSTVSGWQGVANIAINKDATLVLFSSNWGEGSAIDTYVLALTP